MLYPPITKATFKFSKGNKWQGKDVPVLMNPSKLIISLNKETKILGGTGKLVVSKISQSAQSIKNISMELIFDLVEKFEKSSQVGKHLYSAIAGDSEFPDDNTSVEMNNIHIYNKDLCCYKNICDSFVKSDVVKFSWGSDIELIGRISNFYSELNYFSYDGNPLRAIVNLTITREDVGLK